MAIIPQRQLFSWEEVENSADMQRFSLLVKYLPDESLMGRLESFRSKGRNDYPVRAIWNSILAGIVYQHQSIESLRRELMRTAQISLPATPPSNPTKNSYKRNASFLNFIITS